MKVGPCVRQSVAGAVLLLGTALHEDRVVQMLSRCSLGNLVNTCCHCAPGHRGKLTLGLGVDG